MVKKNITDLFGDLNYNGPEQNVTLNSAKLYL